MGARKPGSQGARRTPLKPSRRECRMIWLNLWCLPPAFFVAGGPWVRPSPGIPCALLMSGGTCSRITRAQLRAENADSCSQRLFEIRIRNNHGPLAADRLRFGLSRTRPPVARAHYARRWAKWPAMFPIGTQLEHKGRGPGRALVLRITRRSSSSGHRRSTAPPR